MNAEHRRLHLICRGCGNEYEAEAFNFIMNHFVKPDGGLWASPVGSKWGWIDWCKSEGFRLKEVTATSFRFWYEGNVLLIDSLAHALEMPWYLAIPNTSIEYPNFEAMKRAGIDAIWLTTKGQGETRLGNCALGKAINLKQRTAENEETETH